MKRILLALLPLALAACASAPPANQQAAAAGADTGKICERDTSTGTMFPKTRCTTAAEREAEHRGVDNVNDAVRNQRASQPGKGGA